MQDFTHVRIALAALGQPDADHQRREFEQDEEDHHVPLVFLAHIGQIGGTDGKGDDADRAVMRRDRRGIGARQPAQALQDGKGDQGQQGADTHDHQRRQQQFGQRLAGQLDAALEADGKQQKDAQGFVEHRRYLEIGTRQPGEHAEQEKEDHGFKRHRTHRKSKRRELSHR
ncbi:hypothetical protein SDC9_182674 [bioreactor metagenome]|uniref:Uncharacterized protein n=1 Tax=bioreactor metagenome TaxID=1076179 RepID=A0A645HAN2_9ZZZZ